MALTIKHTKVSAIPDGTDTSVVRPSDWNADHAFTGVLDFTHGGTGQTTSGAALNAMLPTQTGNAGKVLGTNGTDPLWVNQSAPGGVTQIIAGTNVTIDPVSGTGAVTINASGGGGTLIGQTQNVSPFETALGFEAGNANTGVNNTYMGYQAGRIITGGTNNVVMGYQALDASTIPASSVIIGATAAGSTTSSSQNVVIGHSAAGTTTALGADNVLVGFDTGRTLTGTSNVFIGSTSGNNATSVTGAIGIGVGCFGAITSAAAGAVAVGNQALGSLTTGANNTAIGNLAGTILTTGANNTCLGANAGKTMTTALLNTFIGSNAGANTTGGTNTIVGGTANSLLTTGFANTLIGVGAGSNLTTGNNNTIIGNFTMPASSSSNYVVLADGVGDLAVMFNDAGAMTFDGINYGLPGQILRSNSTSLHPTWVNPNIGLVQTLSVSNGINPADTVTFADASTGSFTLTLPAAGDAAGLTLTVKRTDTNVANTVTIASAGGLIEGLTTQQLGISVAVTYCSDGTNWWELANG